MIAVLLVGTCGGIWLGAAVVARHRAQAAADLAAVAAAARLAAGVGPACAGSESVIRRMGARQVDCHAEGLDVVVTVAVPVRLSVWGDGRSAWAAARAGPS